MRRFLVGEPSASVLPSSAFEERVFGAPIVINGLDHRRLTMKWQMKKDVNKQ